MCSVRLCGYGNLSVSPGLVCDRRVCACRAFLLRRYFGKPAQIADPVCTVVFSILVVFTTVNIMKQVRRGARQLPTAPCSLLCLCVCVTRCALVLCELSV
jgi:hypothetical protein